MGSGHRYLADRENDPDSRGTPMITQKGYRLPEWNNLLFPKRGTQFSEIRSSPKYCFDQKTVQIRETGSSIKKTGSLSLVAKEKGLKKTGSPFKIPPFEKTGPPFGRPAMTRFLDIYG